MYAADLPEADLPEQQILPENCPWESLGRIVLYALVGPTMTCSTIQADNLVAVVPRTISRPFAEVNLQFKLSFRCYTSEIPSAVVPSQSGAADWQKVLFSDEFRRVLGTGDNRVQTWRHSGE